MKIQDIKQNQISPFEIEDIKLKNLFSFYLHLAPTINSGTAVAIDDERLSKNWDNFKETFGKDNFIFLAQNCQIEKCFYKYNLLENSEVNRRRKSFVCKKENSLESEYHCILRHLRNSIAHSNVFLSNAGNRKYILFDDYNPKSNNMTARILFSQTDLSTLKKIIMA